jgi:hypothetical protein
MLKYKITYRDLITREMMFNSYEELYCYFRHHDILGAEKI